MFPILQIFLTAIATFVFLMVGAFVFVVAMSMLLFMAIWQKIAILLGKKTDIHVWQDDASQESSSNKAQITIIDVDYKDVSPPSK